MKIRNYLIVKTSEIILVVLILLLCLSFKAHSQVQTSNIFNSGMVLQRGAEIPVTGTGNAGSEVSVAINGASSTGIVDNDKKWKVILPAMEAGGPFEMVITSGDATKTLTNVYVGDVWLASGQSNMEMTVSNANNGANEIASANNQMIRQFQIPKTISKEEKDVLPSGCAWTPATKAFVGNFTATGYYFAKALYSDINVPVGIINTSYGGARIEAWMSEETLGYDEEDVVLAGGTYQERQPTVCYNQMLKPLAGFPIKGFIWYQGESNADNIEDALEYGSLFKKMITEWRKLWGNENLPFIWVQLPNFGEVYPEPNTWDAWPQLRANQTRALALPNTAEAVTIDIGDVDIHPKDKIPVGERLALCARKIAYNEDIVYSGPRYKSHYLSNDGKVVVKFDHTGSGLVAKNSTTGSITGFAYAGKDGILKWANASLKGDSVIIENIGVEELRYAWEYNPAGVNLYNAEGLPAAPFKININDPGFVIKSFNASASLLERGQTSVLSWETYGAAEVTLNGSIVDPISGIRVLPQDTTTYSLKITDINNPSIILEKNITINVIDPLPTISIRTDVGGITAPGTEITLIADATAPKGRTVKQVDFYIDGKLVGSDETKPYEAKWTPSEAGEFSYTAKVTDNTDISVTSASSAIYVTKLKIVYYEAESATYTGTGSVVSNNKCSGKKYLDLQSGWVLTFDNVEVPETDEYSLTIRYLLNYQSPKAQTLFINGVNKGDINFTAPNTTTWMSLVMNVNLNKGLNTIALDDSWGWMSFDYIAIAIEDTSTVTDTTNVSVNSLRNENISLNCMPNPADSFSTISYTISNPGSVKLELFDITGRKVKTISESFKKAGSHKITLDCHGLGNNIYFIKMEAGGVYRTSKLILIK
ncbi:MAG: T9SS type A sorting domain-containing protein [Prolixibacteraceae bacterium]|nr:T9SS type A sorting domain-containing protein [Prolixibacteraceae bacterium]